MGVCMLVLERMSRTEKRRASEYGGAGCAEAGAHPVSPAPIQKGASTVVFTHQGTRARPYCELGLCGILARGAHDCRGRPTQR